MDQIDYFVLLFDCIWGLIMDDIQFQKLLHHFNLSWEGCRKVRKGVKKRIRRHMQSLRSRDIKEYLDILAKNPDIRKECELLMTVATSRYFRDKRLWEEFLCKKLLEIAGRYEGTMRV
jgi:chemotaxis protein methyltransferase CheR